MRIGASGGDCATGLVFSEMPARDAKRILLLKLSSMGDIIHTLPALSVLRKGYPEADITWVVDERWQDILEGNPDLTRIVALNKKRLAYSLYAWREAAKILRSFKPDLCIDFQGLFYTGFLSYLSGANDRIGFASAREFSPWFYTERFGISFEGIHAVERYMKLAQFAGAVDSTIEFKIVTGERDIKYIGTFLGEHSLLVAIHPGARWQTKRWSLEGFARVADYLSNKYKAQIILIGAREDTEYNNRMKSLMSAKSLDLTGKTDLKQLAALFEKTDLLLTNDSGPMHLAAALGRRVLAIFGPTDPARTGPYGQSRNVVRQDISCRPCFKKHCGSLLCLTGVSVEAVIKAAEEVLKTGR